MHVAGAGPLPAPWGSVADETLRARPERRSCRRATRRRPAGATRPKKGARGRRGRRRRDAAAYKGHGTSDPERPGRQRGGECARAVRVPARPRSRARGLGPRGLRARPSAQARVTSSRPTRQAWDLQGRAGDFWGKGTPRPEGRDRGACCPSPRPGTVGDAGPGRAEPAFCFGSLRVCSLTLDSRLSLPGLNVLIIEMGRLNSLSSQVFLP
jgi:hypothetical protein